MLILYRLPISTAIQNSLRADDTNSGVQFVAGLEAWGDDLLMSYGDADCESQVGISVALEVISKNRPLPFSRHSIIDYVSTYTDTPT